MDEVAEEANDLSYMGGRLFDRVDAFKVDDDESANLDQLNG